MHSCNNPASSRREVHAHAHAIGSTLFEREKHVPHLHPTSLVNMIKHNDQTWSNYQNVSHLFYYATLCSDPFVVVKMEVNEIVQIILSVYPFRCYLVGGFNHLDSY